MGLSEDQKAMLRLLAQREQGYEDIAALMGLSVEQVRERVAGALKQLEQEGEAPPEELRAAGPVADTGPSSSQAAGEDPVSAPPAAGAPAEETPVAPEPPEEVPAGPAEQAPAAEAMPAPAPPPKEPTSSAGQSRSGVPKMSLPSGQGARAALAAGVAVVVLVIVVLVLSGGDSSDNSTTASNFASGTTAESLGGATGNEKEVTKAVLSPVGGAPAGATGVAIFGRVGKKLALQVEAEGLEPTDKAHSYTVWLAQSPQKMLPLAEAQVGKDGQLGAQFEVPTEVLVYLANETFGELVVTETSNSELEAALTKATKEKKTPAYTGTPVLQGTVTGPIVGAANRSE